MANGNVGYSNKLTSAPTAPAAAAIPGAAAPAPVGVELFGLPVGAIHYIREGHIPELLIKREYIINFFFRK